MAGTTFDALVTKAEAPELIRLPKRLALFLAPYGTTLPAKLIDADGGIITLPEAWKPVGEITEDGITFEGDVEKKERTVHGKSQPARIDVTKVPRTVKFTAAEYFRKMLLEISQGVDLSGKNFDTTGELVWQLPDVPVLREYAALVLAEDGTPDDYWVWGRGFPRIKPSSLPSEQWGSEYLEQEFQFDVLSDPTAGYAVQNYLHTNKEDHITKLGFTKASA